MTDCHLIHQASAFSRATVTLVTARCSVSGNRLAAMEAGASECSMPLGLTRPAFVGRHVMVRHAEL